MARMVSGEPLAGVHCPLAQAALTLASTELCSGLWSPSQPVLFTSSFQNYMGPLRLVLSPADMATVFINLEVSFLVHPCQAYSCLQRPCPWGLAELCRCQCHGWLMVDRWENSFPH